MTINVKFLSEQQIERDALGLLEDYFGALGEEISAPVPVDDILETHLGVSLDFEDLSNTVGSPDVLGATYAKSRSVFIDASLDPIEHPTMEGRYHFTVAHEIGHWILHVPRLRGDELPTVMHRQLGSVQMLVCALGGRKEPIEWQADRFASSLLMPRHLVEAAWAARFPSSNGRGFVFDPRHWTDLTHRLERRRMRHVGKVISEMVEPRPADVKVVFRDVAKYFAPQFRVSAQAMQFRLEDLGLLQFPACHVERRSSA